MLGAIARHDGATAVDLASELRLPRSSTHRMLAALIQLRLVARGAGDGYVLGPLIGDLAGAATGKRRLVHVSHPIMVALRDACRETVGVHVLESDQRVLLHQVETTHEHRWVYMNPGQYMPLHAGASSKMLLALLGQRGIALLETMDLRVFTRHTARDAERLGRELRRIRRQGYAISLEEVNPGIASIAMPIDTGDPALLAVMSVTGPTVRVTPLELQRIRPMLARAVAEVGGELRRLTGARRDVDGGAPSPPRARGGRRAAARAVAAGREAAP